MSAWSGSASVSTRHVIETGAGRFADFRSMPLAKRKCRASGPRSCCRSCYRAAQRSGARSSTSNSRTSPPPPPHACSASEWLRSQIVDRVDHMATPPHAGHPRAHRGRRDANRRRALDQEDVELIPPNALGRSTALDEGRMVDTRVDRQSPRGGQVATLANYLGRDRPLPAKAGVMSFH